MGADDEKLLMEQVCAIIVDAGYRFCWAGAAEQDDEKRVRPIAWTGYESGFLSSVGVTWSDLELGRGPSGKAIRTAKPVVIQDLAESPDFFPWRMEADKRGYRSCSALPLMADGVAFGVLVIYADQPRVFGEAEVELLTNLAEILSFGVTNLRERLGAELALREASDLNQQVVSATRMGIVVYDQSLRCQMWNPFMEELTGLSAKEMVGGFPLEKFPFLTKLSMEAGLQKAFAGEANITDEVFLNLSRRGTLRVSLQYTPLRNSFGQVHKALATLQDVTGRKKTEEALHQSEQRLRQAARVSQIGIFEHDHLADTIYWSPEQRAIYGFGPDEEVVLQRFIDQVYSEDRESTEAAVRRAHDPRNDGLFDIDHRIVRRDGSVRYLSTRSQTFFEGEGEARHKVRTVGAVADITERKLAEQALREIFDNAVLGIFQSTPDGRYLRVNQAMARMYGYTSPEELIATVTDIEFQEYVDPSRRAEFKQLIEGQGVVRDFEYEVHRKDGSRGWVVVNARIARNKRGTETVYEGTAEDVTEHKRLEAQYQQSQKMEAIGRLAGGVAHDFSNILGVIMGYCDLATEQESRDLVMQNIPKIKQAAERAANLTKQLLTISKQEIIHPRVLDLNKVVSNVSEMLKRLVGRDVEISFIPGERLGLIRADLGQVDQILMNLAVNSRDAMPNGGKIAIQTNNASFDEGHVQQHPSVIPGAYVKLSVSDEGTGIAEESLPHIFEPFFTTKEPGKGTGLGLATVYGTVKQSGGYIWVYSEINKGTTFEIYFPKFEENQKFA
jgi:two-component system cell cycle sensor histidine kinase/response regulator CckA